VMALDVYPYEVSDVFKIQIPPNSKAVIKARFRADFENEIIIRTQRGGDTRVASFNNYHPRSISYNGKGFTVRSSGRHSAIVLNQSYTKSVKLWAEAWHKRTRPNSKSSWVPSEGKVLNRKRNTNGRLLIFGWKDDHRNRNYGNAILEVKITRDKRGDIGRK